MPDHQCQGNGNGLHRIDCCRDHAFTLTATFTDGTESPHSAPFLFKLDGDGDRIHDPSWEIRFFGTTAGGRHLRRGQDGYTDLREFVTRRTAETKPPGRRL